MSTGYSTYAYVDRESGGFDLQFNYSIDPYYDPETGEVFNETYWIARFAPGGWSTEGFGIESGWASIPLAFATDGQPQVITVTFQAENRFSREALAFDLRVIDAALSTATVRLGGTEGMDLMLGGGAADVLRGEAGQDWLDAGAGDDRLMGGGGSDWLDGGAGADRMMGGSDFDYYRVDDASDVVVEVDEDSGFDDPWFGDGVFASISYRLPRFVERLDLAGDADLDGTGNDAANVISGTIGANRLVGLGGNDRLLAADGDDLLVGGEGDDWLEGGVGDDRMIGGAGDDTYQVLTPGDRVVEEAGGGIDTVRTNLDVYRLAETLENLEFAFVDDVRGIGNAAANRITGGTGEDRLMGESGDDVLMGGGGADRLTGGTGADTFVFRLGESAPSARDRVLDYARSEGDRIDFTHMGALAFRGEAEFTGAGHEVRVRYLGGDTFVEVDYFGNRHADVSVRLEGNHAITVADLVP
jgi:Ca2+-binding RTX toxin-like protein